MSTVDFLEKQGLRISNKVGSKACVECLVCGWKEVRNIYNLAYRIKKYNSDVCRSCRLIKEDNKVVEIISQRVSENNGICYEKPSNKARGKRKYKHKQGLKVNVCGHDNFLSYEEVLEGYTGRCNSCAHGSLPDRDIVELAKSKGINISVSNILRGKERTYIIGGFYSCGHEIHRMRLSHLKKRTTGLCSSCITRNRNRVNITELSANANEFLNRYNLRPEVIIPKAGRSYVIFDCISCGKRTKRNLSYIANHHKAVCNNCCGSAGELIIARWLDRNGFNYEREKEFEDLYGHTKRLRYDFFLTQNLGYREVMIEFDGIFHYDDTLKRTQNIYQDEYDALKDNYCKINNYPLLRIPYFESQKMDEYLERFTKKIKENSFEDMDAIAHSR